MGDYDHKQRPLQCDGKEVLEGPDKQSTSNWQKWLLQESAFPHVTHRFLELVESKVSSGFSSGFACTTKTVNSKRYATDGANNYTIRKK